MSRKRLYPLFHPKSIAVIGASSKKEHAGHAIMQNLIIDGFDGKVFPVNPHAESVLGSKTYKTVGDIPDQVDLAVIATPAATVPGLIDECGNKGIQNAIIISSGFKEVGDGGKKLSDELQNAALKHNVNILGPNCLGFIHPSTKLNASFAGKMALPGKIAFISQSGALCTSVLDWSLKEQIGFSYFVSIGEMMNVGFHDLIDYFGNDPNTESILIYMESLTEPKKFLSAARAYARTKPIIILKAGKSLEGAKAALSHTGGLAGNDNIFNAAFRRTGILRVDTIAELFDCAELLSSKKYPTDSRLAVITNAGGPGVIATDYLISQGGSLTQLAPETVKALDEVMPQNWSHGNPLDILGDADPARYGKALEIVMKDPQVDSVLVLLTPQAMTDPTAVAYKIAEMNAYTRKSIFVSLMGGAVVEEGKKILEENHIPTYATPEDAIKGFINLHSYRKNLNMLYETPSTTPHAFTPKTAENKAIIQKVAEAGRLILTESEVKEMLSNYSMPVLPSKVAHTKEEAAAIAKEMGFPVVMKIVSPQIFHKTEVKGIRLNVHTPESVMQLYDEMTSYVASHVVDVKIEGVLIEPMMAKKYELFIGSKKDPFFGAVIVFGMGGIAVEIFNDVTVGLPPLNMALAEHMIEDTRIYKVLKGFRGTKGVDIPAIQFLLYKFAYLVMDFPEIKEIDINPFGVDEKGGMVLDAKILLDEAVLKNPVKPFSHLVISPYPKEYIKTTTLKNGDEITLRPIRPEDEPMEAEMFTHFSPETQRFRFFSEIKDITHEMLIRYTQIDYDREMAIIAESEAEGRKIMRGVARIIADPYNENAEFAIVVADPWQGQGLGGILTDYIMQIAREKGVKKIYAFTLPENSKMKTMMQKRNFSLGPAEGGLLKAELTLQ